MQWPGDQIVQVQEKPRESSTVNDPGSFRQKIMSEKQLKPVHPGEVLLEEVATTINRR
jgi:hypothetical protein